MHLSLVLSRDDDDNGDGRSMQVQRKAMTSRVHVECESLLMRDWIVVKYFMREFLLCQSESYMCIFQFIHSFIENRLWNIHFFRRIIFSVVISGKCLFEFFLTNASCKRSSSCMKYIELDVLWTAFFATYFFSSIMCDSSYRRWVHILSTRMTDKSRSV